MTDVTYSPGQNWPVLVVGEKYWIVLYVAPDKTMYWEVWPHAPSKTYPGQYAIIGPIDGNVTFLSTKEPGP